MIIELETSASIPMGFSTICAANLSVTSISTPDEFRASAFISTKPSAALVPSLDPDLLGKSTESNA